MCLDTSGGQCRTGAAAAVFGKWVTNHTPQDWGVAARGVAATVAGGVGSVIGGGKFENGAVTAAYGYLFNAVLTSMKNGQTLRANYKGEAGSRQEHAVHGPGGSYGPNGESFGYHAHIYDANGSDTGVRVHTHPEKFGQPLTADSANKMTTDMRKNLNDMNTAQRRVVYQMNRSVFHTGNVPTQLRMKSITLNFPSARGPN